MYHGYIYKSDKVCDSQNFRRCELPSPGGKIQLLYQPNMECKIYICNKNIYKASNDNVTLLN